MNMNVNYETKHRPLLGLLLALFACCLVACHDNDVNGAQDYDPTKEVVVTSFVPESGGVGQQLVIRGANFGTNVDNVQVTIGGKTATVVSVLGDCLYCYVPSGAFTGEIAVTVGDESLGGQTAYAPKNFNYERKMVVGELCGKKNERDNQGWNDGTFETVTGFRNDGVMQFSPYNHDQLFVVYDQEPQFGTVAHGIQLIDLKAETVETILPLTKFSNERLRTIDFAVDPYAYDDEGNILFEEETIVDEETGEETIISTPVRSDAAWEASASDLAKSWKEHLIISADNEDNNYRAHSVYIVDRDESGNFGADSPVKQLANYRQCNGASLHPVNGELYFTSFANGEVLRLDMEKYWETIPYNMAWDPYVNNNLTNTSTGETSGTGAFEKLFTVQDVGWEFQIDIHPSGKYAYIVVINQHYILRTDYNEATKRFSPPYQVAGQMKAPGFVDGVGKSAQVNRPYQGTFFKNDDYEAEGREDIYDFYFCDSQNNAVRYLTPDGIIRTYAGGSSATHADGNTAGSENGELRDVARFNRPTGIVNDFHISKTTGEKTPVFYILDTMNRKIRTITMEEPEEEEQTVDTDDYEEQSETEE